MVEQVRRLAARTLGSEVSAQRARTLGRGQEPPALEAEVEEARAELAEARAEPRQQAEEQLDAAGRRTTGQYEWLGRRVAHLTGPPVGATAASSKPMLDHQNWHFEQGLD